ncbi:MAG TPA: hypothetical protein DHV36_16115 [Desulfobacteraceae bacterium]|nr:hypothetical protein [Desulfobacteraceae bacterium]|tara:strand:+ start:1163 stop:2611 length:1449 start_codon:yes stop_codon:yes gene_type:complete
MAKSSFLPISKTEAENSSYVGLDREVIVVKKADDSRTMAVHNGVDAGGFILGASELAACEEAQAAAEAAAQDIANALTVGSNPIGLYVNDTGLGVMADPDNLFDVRDTGAGRGGVAVVDTINGATLNLYKWQGTSTNYDVWSFNTSGNGKLSLFYDSDSTRDLSKSTGHIVTFTPTGFGSGTDTPEAPVHMEGIGSSTIMGSGFLGYVKSTDNSSYAEILFGGKDSSGVGRTGAIGFDPDKNLTYLANGLVAGIGVDASGYVQMGTFSATGATSGSRFVESGRRWDVSASIAVATYANFYNTFGLVGRIRSNDNSVAFETLSDYRAKENLRAITNSWDYLLSLKPYWGNFKSDPDKKDISMFVAHELQEIIPEAVSGTKDGMRTEEYEISPAVYETIVVPAIEEELDEEGNVIVEAQPETTEQVLISEAVMRTREVPDYQGVDQSKVVPLITAALQDAIKTIKSQAITLEGLNKRIAVFEVA